ncbi:PAAR domain-containing protein [Klebsiella pneumoniae]|nr:PAAR domain-containing protein [Klebsiella pneumoniae]
MKRIIRQGDSLKEYGGSVICGHYLYFGKGIAVKGDAVKCNKHGMTTIVEGSSLTKVDGRCACGCTLVSSNPDCRVAQ